MILGIEKGKRSENYIKAARELGISYKIIDTRSNRVMSQIKEIDAFIWHWSHLNYREQRSAKAILKSAELLGIKTYPNIKTCWMFDDKISEKYLLEAISAPLVQTYVFWSFEEAISWLSARKFPVVYKLPQGAGSTGVGLIHNMDEGKKVCYKHFGVFGKPEINLKFDSLLEVRKICSNIKQDIILYGPNKKGCILFQDYLPNNQYDIRVTTVGKKNFIFKRYVRDNDFRASGSGKIEYKVDNKDLESIRIARKISDLIGAQTMAYDFIYDKEGNHKICEISYGFVEETVNQCQGWYDDDLHFHREEINVYHEVINNLRSVI